nr:hypothetical protein [Sphingomonas sp. Y57]
MTTVKTGVSAAASAALIAFTAMQAAPAFADASTEAKTVHCYGVNSCKGASDCATAKHSCKGQNACKGQGYKDMTADACKAAGGTTEPKKK